MVPMPKKQPLWTATWKILRIKGDSKNFNFENLSLNQFSKFLEVIFKVLLNFITEYFSTFLLK